MISEDKYQIRHRRLESAIPWIIAACTIVIAIVILGGGVPYYYRRTDLQDDYFYHALRLSSGHGLGRVVHPGLPAYWLLALVLRIVPDPISHARAVFVLMYLVVMATTLAAVLWFDRRKLTRADPGFRLFVLGLILSWPAYWYYQFTYGADSFVLPASIVLSTLWMGLIQMRREPNTKNLLLIGIATGASLWIKLTLLPLLAGLVAGWIVATVVRREHITRRILLPIVGGIAGFLVLLPFALRSFPVIVQYLLRPPDYLQTHLSSSRALARFFSFYGNGSNFATSLIIASILALFVLTVVALIGRKIRALPVSDDEKRWERGLIAGSVVGLAIVWISLIRLARILPPDAPSRAVALRNLTAVFFAIPFTAIFLRGLLARLWRPSPPPRRIVSLSLAVVGAVLIGWSGLNVMLRFRASAREMGRVEQEVALRIGPLQPGERLATYGIPGESEFHFEGSGSYGNTIFDSAVLAHFPKRTYLRPAALADTLRDQPQRTAAANPFFRRIRLWWESGFPVERDAPSPLVLNRPPDSVVALVAMGQAILEPENLTKALFQRLNACRVSQFRIDTRQYIIFDIARSRCGAGMRR